MRHQRQGWRRLVALSVAMVGALVIAPGLASASPSTTGNTVLDVTNCTATVAVSWVAQPGRLKTFTTELWSDANTTPVVVGSGSLGRNGTIVLPQVPLSIYADSNQFHAVTRVYDGKGVEQETWPSGDVAGSCI
jgi:hypothetical protein